MIGVIIIKVQFNSWQSFTLKNEIFNITLIFN